MSLSRLTTTIVFVLVDIEERRKPFDMNSMIDPLVYPLNQTALPVVPAQTAQPQAEVAAGNVDVRIVMLFEYKCASVWYTPMQSTWLSHNNSRNISYTRRVVGSFRPNLFVTCTNSDFVPNPQECID